MTREARTGLACVAIVLASVAAVAAVFLAGIVAQPDRVVAENEPEVIR